MKYVFVGVGNMSHKIAYVYLFTPPNFRVCAWQKFQWNASYFISKIFYRFSFRSILKFFPIKFPVDNWQRLGNSFFNVARNEKHKRHNFVFWITKCDKFWNLWLAGWTFSSSINYKTYSSVKTKHVFCEWQTQRKH